LRFNEGNGLQINGYLPGASDTSNKVVANFFYDNCTDAYRGRRLGGTMPTIFIAQLSCAFAYGGETLLANNVFGGATPVGIYVEGHSNRVKVTDNLFLDVPHCVMLPPDCDSDTCDVFHNNYYSRGLHQQMYCTDECDPNHVPLYKPFATDPGRPGTSNLTFDTLVGSSYPH
jgi:nitrous oxidase accessory protein NosD